MGGRELVGTGPAFSDNDRGFDSEVVNFAIPSRRLTQTEKLMLAVLELAVSDLQQTSNPRWRAEAFWYFKSTDQSWDYSFENLCEHFQISPDLARERLGIPSGLEPSLARTYPEPGVMKHRIREVLGRTRRSTKITDIRAMIGGGDYSYIDEKLREMVDEGSVERVKWGVYRVAVCP